MNYTDSKFSIRPATSADLDAINRVIEKAVMNWPVPNRLKRVAVPVLTYREGDSEYDFLVATVGGHIVGVAAFDPAPTHALPNGQGGILHGLYVLPLLRGQGIGEALMDAAFSAAREKSSRGMLIKAQRVSRGYFEQQSLEALAANDDEYPWQYWKRLA